MFYSSHNWKDENTNIYNYKTSNRFLYSSVFSDKFFAEGNSSDLGQLHPL